MKLIYFHFVAVLVLIISNVEMIASMLFTQFIIYGGYYEIVDHLTLKFDAPFFATKEYKPIITPSQTISETFRSIFTIPV